MNEERNLYIGKIKENFHIYGVAVFLYACLFAFCMYDNDAGITYALYSVGTIALIMFFAKKLEFKLKRVSIFYITSIMLLSIATFCTDDDKIIFFNKCGVLLLTICFVLDIIYDTKKWTLGKYFNSILNVFLMSIGEIFNPFGDFLWYCKNKMSSKNSNVFYVVVGIVITIPLFVVVFAMLSSADVVFRNFADGIFEGFSLSAMISIGFRIGLMFVVTYSIMCYTAKKELIEEVSDKKNMEPLIAIPMALIMTVLYLVFSVIQIVYLFMGNMELPDGYTYAEYAREGFFQLLAVSILNLIIVLVCLCYFKPNKLFKGILAVMSICTFIMIASSALRMIIYIQYYYLTFLRILVLWSLVVLALVFIGVMIYIFTDTFPLFRYSMVVVTCLYIVLAFAKPDYWIAKVNVEGSKETRSVFFKGAVYNDFYLFEELSADATPVIIEWMEDKGSVIKGYYLKNIGYVRTNSDQCGYIHMKNALVDTEDMGIREFNVSRYRAKKMIMDKIED
ncbi:MAG: DUF4173 domain-containing protein [Lachnospiraceae bacterium]|nr:DUF4173 domain-containing protein [Lachnospiraceae bacterium]